MNIHVSLNLLFEKYDIDEEGLVDYLKSKFSNEYRLALKDLKDEKKQYENFIIDYMEENHNIEVSSGGSRIKKAVQKTRAGFNEKVIIVGLTEITKGDETKAKDITKIISQKREMKEKTYLKKAKKP